MRSGPCWSPCKGILARDGLGKVQVLGASAVVGTGVDKVRAAIRQVVMQRQALSQRLAADVDRAAARLAEASGTGEAAGVKGGTRDRLADELAVAANVPLVVDAVARSYRQEATRRTGWPVTRWLVRFRPDPLRRLNLRRTEARPELNRTSLPPAGAPERARTDAAVREFADAASDGAPGPWRAVIRGAAREGRERLPDALDQAIAGTDLKAGRSSWWWTAFNVVQWLGLLVALGGLGWLGVLAGAGVLPAARAGDPPGGGLAGAHRDGGRGSAAGHCPGPRRRSSLPVPRRRARARAARRRLEAAVAAVAEELVVEPVELEVSRLRSFNAALKAAAG